ncbi:hypothetical protein CK215_04280 [Mesorhizobium sp. WSM3864]|uniref:HNH endonuclease n=1 Tax=Mesorhizobium sp. WSM3864 TaxID=2029404 RepID=UPI000BD63DBC|nr:HNH endonuclease [Mesorhizobium sp. WSM3864]PBB93200.1 hypothetical protein CK215_04280 [Mesorhizobium sp. WSM3864]
MTGEIVVREEETLVVRSAVPAGLPYPKYRNFLRHDFFHSCAYCTMTEAEAAAIRFTIDHYEPQTARPDLVDVYDNLMWACDECNTRKGTRSPPAAARADGLRFFRPDADEFLDHFERKGLELRSLTKTGWYSIHALDLNREALQRLRDLRRRLSNCEAHITAGVRALRSFSVDRLPPHLRGPAARGIKALLDAHDNIATAIEDLLRENAKSELIDEDGTQVERAKERTAKLKAAESLYPGQDWRAPTNRKPNRNP